MIKTLWNRVVFLFTPTPEYGPILWSILTIKRFFDMGYGQTGYIKYAVALLGLGSRDVGQTMEWAIYYGIFCLFLGFFWHLFKLVDAEVAIGNRFNDFVAEMREMKNKVG